MAKESAGTSQGIQSQKNRYRGRESTSVKELTQFQNQLIAKQFAGILQSVVPDITKSLKTVVKDFSKSLISPTDKKIQTTYGNLKTFLDNFDVSISDLGSGFDDVEEVFKTLTKQFADVGDNVEKLREKNIFAESRLVVNKKNNNLEVKAIILTDQELFEKREALLKKEKELKAEEKEYLAQIRKLESGKIQMDDSDRAELSQNLQDNLGKQENVRGEIGKYQGKGGDSSIGIVDKFERFLEDRGPSFLTAALGPIIDIARDFEKTIKLMISGISGIISGIKKAANFVGKLLPDSFKKGFGNIMKGLGGRLKSFGKSLGLASLGLLTFVGRILLTGLTMLLAIVAPLLPLIPPLLLFAVAIALVVGAIYLLKKAFTALIDWFRESALGKLLGLDKESTDKAEVKDKKEGTGKYQGFDDEMDFGDKGSPKVIAEKPLMPANTGNGEKFRGTKDSKGRSQIERFEDDQKQIALQKSQNPEALKRQEALSKFNAEDYIKASEKQYDTSIDPSELSDREKFKFMRTGKIVNPLEDKMEQDKFKKPDTIKKDLKGEGTSTSSNVTTVVNNQPSSSNTQVANTSMFSPINVSSGDSYFDRQANASNF
jgi:hypothetical protein